ITRAIDYMTFLAKPKKLPNTKHGKNFTFKLNFITLTLASAQVHTDQEIKSELLHQFFIEMARRWKVPTYIWRAEKQKNGSIHFHIITGKFIHWNELRNVWNRIQQKLGYVTRYRENRLNWHREGFRYNPDAPSAWTRAKQLKAYKVGLRTDWDNPNSTDVHSIRHIGNIRAYFVKYMTKSQTESGLAGRLWGCSVNLSHLSGARTDIDTKLEQELEQIFNHKTCWTLQTQYYTVYCIDHNVVKALGCDKLLECFDEYIRQKFPEQHPPTLF
ncbi:unnamed protein product, partial [marine sediment metagenome]